MQNGVKDAILLYMKRTVELTLFVLLVFSISIAPIIHRATVCHGNLEGIAPCIGSDMPAILIPAGTGHAACSAHDSHAEHHEHCLQKLCSAPAHGVARYAAFAGFLTLPIFTDPHLFPLFFRQHTPMQPVVNSAPQRSAILTL